jgi:tol-pal system-associated acyl-CoA thioesterase
MSGTEFSLPTRVYIEDTDAGGIVYYVNYLKYMERARTEFLRALGFARPALFREDRLFVVREVALTYRAPARLDDLLQATVTVERAAGAALVLLQRVDRDGETLVEGRVTVACVDRDSLRPRRIPTEMLATLRARRDTDPSAAHQH